MLVRALIVVLAILNLGVALWWGSRPAAPDIAPPAPATGVATLQLVAQAASAAPAADAPAPAPAAPASVPATTPVAAVASAECFSIGPFSSRAEANAALTRGRGAGAEGRVREEVAADAASYRVLLPVAGDREAAQAAVKRIADAGFSDYYLIAQDGHNSIALGQYRSRDGAERRQQALAAAGFSVEVLPSGGGASRWWSDLRSASGSAVRQAFASGLLRSLECARMR